MTTYKSPLVQQNWEKWFENRDNDAANELIKSYHYLVVFHVDRIAINLPQSVSRDDLESYALLGLYDAMKKFEADRQLKFDTYASFRIRGSIIDGLRKEDWLPRTLREKTKQVNTVSEELEQQLHREPSSEEIAEKIGHITAIEVETIINDAFVSNVLSIEGKRNSQSEEIDDNIGYYIPDDETPLPDDYILNLEFKEELAQKIRMLNDTEQMVIGLFYFDELTMTEIGEVLELTTSRISQIHKSSIFKLRHTLEKMSQTD